MLSAALFYTYYISGLIHVVKELKCCNYKMLDNTVCSPERLYQKVALSLNFVTCFKLHESKNNKFSLNLYKFSGRKCPLFSRCYLGYTDMFLGLFFSQLRYKWLT